MPTAQLDRPLLRALFFTFFAHALAMLSMALLLPGLPGGSSNSPQLRAAYVASHSILWRIGWLPWMLTALSDLLLCIALLDTRWIPKLPAATSLLFVTIGLFPDQAGQFLWITRGVRLAREAISTGDFTPYFAFEQANFTRIAYIATAFYLAAALGWTWSFVAAGLWNPLLSRLSFVMWSCFLFACASPWLAQHAPSAALIAMANAIGFILLQLWFAILIELLLRRSRPIESHGRHAPWSHPRPSPLGKISNLAANSHFLRACCEPIPPLAFRSDITDTIYINYLLPTARLHNLTPPGLELDLLGPQKDHALFSILTLRHGHFGPRILDPLRRLMPSPIQSNWRIYVRHRPSGFSGIYFFTNAIDSTLHALSARLLSENMPMHVLDHAEIRRTSDAAIHLDLQPGQSTAPDLQATLFPATDRALPPHWRDVFPDYRSFLAYCVPQDRAMSSQPWHARMTRQEIDLGIPLDICQPLAGQVSSRAAEKIAGDSPPVCFLVPQVRFLFTAERYEPLETQRNA